MREELSKATTELSQIREELNLCIAQKEKIGLQVMMFTDKTFHFDTHVDKGHLRVAGILLFILVTCSLMFYVQFCCFNSRF